MWDLNNLDQPPLVLHRQNDAVMSVAFSPDGERLASASIDGTARVSDARSGATLLTVGSARVSAADNRATGVLGLQPFRSLAQLAARHDALWNVAFSPDGKRLITAGGTAGGTATIWDATSGQELRVLHGHADTVVAATFSTDGRRVATASRDGTARVWDAATGIGQLTLYGDGVGLGGVAFSPDGNRLAVGSDHAARVYALRLEDLVALARTRLTRTWTTDECQRFLDREACPS